MKKNALLTALVSLLITLAGCIDHTSVVMVNRDGSGTVTDVTYLGQAMQQMMQMAAMMGGVQNQNPGRILSEDEMKAKALSMGEGVTFTSAQEVKKQDGTTGIKVIYSFADVNKLKFFPDPDAADKGQGTMSNAQPADKSDPITFEFQGGESPSLFINIPRNETEAEQTTATAPRPAPAPEETAMMKQMFNGMKFRIIVGVEGSIRKTNAGHVSKDKDGQDKYVTLFEVDMDELMKDEQMLDKITALGEMNNVQDAMEKMKNIPGLKAETAERVEISF